MRLRLWLILALAALIAGGVAHAAFAGHDAKKQTLTASQRAARNKLLAEARFLKQNNLTCGCRHHFPAPKP